MSDTAENFDDLAAHRDEIEALVAEANAAHKALCVPLLAEWHEGDPTALDKIKTANDELARQLQDMYRRFRK